MKPAFDLRSAAGWFRLIALAEAVSWVGLLIGMYFKYLGTTRTEIGVKVFGMAHGLIFIAFVVAGLLTGIAFKWAAGTWLLALLASIVPLCSVIFLIWAESGPPTASRPSCNRDGARPKRHDRLGGVSRPRPPIAASMAGAVDLSALKQRTAPAGEGDGGAAQPRGLEITEANLEAEVLVRSSQIPVVVLLWSPRSEASAQLGDALAQLAAADAGKWSLATVNVDAVPRVAQMFGVQAVPTVVALAAGQPLSSFQGSQPPDQLRRWVDSLLDATAGKLGGAGDGEEPEQVDPELAQAREHLDSGDFDAALRAYQALLDANPNHAEAKGAVRQIGFLQRATSRAPGAIVAADAAPDDIEVAFAAADVEILQQDVASAFDRLIALVKRSAGDERTKVRTRLIELFDLFDPADPEVIAGRRKLANALY
jgi:putative thioredoxin